MRAPLAQPSGPPAKLGFLLIEDLAGLSVADLNLDVVVGLGDSSHHPDERWSAPACKAMPASHPLQFLSDLDLTGSASALLTSTG